MMRRFLSLALLALAACQQSPERSAGNDMPSAPVPGAGPTPVPASRDLSRYLGQYPTEAVAGGTSFLADPAVRDAVAAAVPDAEVRTLVLGSEVTATPIAEVEGRMLAYGCEPHNCGPHNWAIAITPDAARAAVCYYDEDRRIARWYPENTGPDPGGGCPSGD